MKCPACGRDSGLNPFSICQFCGNALQQDEEDANRDASSRRRLILCNNYTFSNFTIAANLLRPPS